MKTHSPNSRSSLAVGLTALIASVLCLFSLTAWANTAQAQAGEKKAHKPGKNLQQSPKKPKKKNKTSAHQRTPNQPAAVAANAGPLSATPEVSTWVQEAASRLPLDPAWTQKTMAQAQRLPLVEKWVLPPASPVAKDWGAYRARFIEPVRIQAGWRFWQKHQAALAKAEREYGVPASLIVGIIGVETLYGQNTGNFRVLDALGTLAFHFPQAHPRAAERQAFFRSELEQFLLLTSRSGADPVAIRGSYAGALGLPQFMPSSWAKFAVDFDEDGRIDLFGSPADAIGSVANYFKAFQWRPGMPTHYPVTLTPGQTDMDSLMAPDILPTFSVANFMAKGAALEGAALEHSGPLALIELRNGANAPSYVAGTENFYAITRYNWSSYYAMAVIELAEAVAREMQRKP
ncbi:lytic murein transglycosylase B [Limnohabitans sp. DCL3]|uniref:lytic murein transglycosylase B n=1 Tax=Limnohabitans sp. DCL3 TaxID=3374103 RepID=UPI003A88E6B0